MFETTLPAPTSSQLLVAALLAVALLSACSAPADHDAASGAAGQAPAPEPAAGEPAPGVADTAATYVVRGALEGVPGPGKPQHALLIRHEAIDNFAGVGGEVWGMDSMTMPFLVDEDLPLEGYQIGDKIRFTLVIDWFQDPAQEIIAIEKLPADTELTFRAAQPPAEEAKAEAGNVSENPAGDDGDG